MESTSNYPTPYYAVIFTSQRTGVNSGYSETNDLLLSIANELDGFLGEETARDENLGVSVSYWRDLESIKVFKEQVDHRAAQERGRKEWYTNYHVRISKVEREYSFQLKSAE